MLNRNEIIEAMNYANSFVPKDNEIHELMEEAIWQLEQEWKGQFISEEEEICFDEE